MNALKRPQPHRLSSFDLVEGFQLSHAVSALHSLDVFASLRKPATAESLATAHGLNGGLLRGVLEYVAARTDLIRKVGSRFVATGSYSRASRFLLDLYAGAYGNNAAQLTTLLRKPQLAGRAVDRVRHARAFAGVSRTAFHGLAELIRQLRLNYLLDLGCGSAGMLVELALANPDFVAWGLETNPAMCKVARSAIRSAGLGRRITIFEGDSRRLAKIFRRDIRSQVQAVAAVQIANEMFGQGSSGAVNWLREIRKSFPGRPLLVGDYYGRLLTKNQALHRETLLHDYVQVISGQGVPPANFREWRKIYAAAGCRLVQVIEDKSTTQFIHILVL